MRKFSVFLALLISILGSAVPSSAQVDIKFDTPITMKVNGTLVKTDREPFLYEGLTYVPIRFMGGALGAEVFWEGQSSTAVISGGGKEIRLTKGEKGARVDGRFVPLDHGVMLVQDRIYVPVRFVAEEFSCRVDWEGESYSVNLEKDGVSVPPEFVGSRSYTDDDIYWLSKIIHAESRGEPMEGKIAVGNVVLNRVASSSYPNTIYGVIFDKKYGVQFSPVADGSIHQTPLGDSVIAAKRALRGENTAGASLFFLNPRAAQSFWIVEKRTFFGSIGNHDFYL